MSVEALRASQAGGPPQEERRSFPKIEALPGSLHTEHKRCNRATCRCRGGGDALHGPYLYRRWREGGRQRRQYVRPQDAEGVRAGLAAWRRLHPPARSARELLREMRRETRELFRLLDLAGL